MVERFISIEQVGRSMLSTSTLFYLFSSSFFIFSLLEESGCRGWAAVPPLAEYAPTFFRGSLIDAHEVAAVVHTEENSTVA